MTIRSHMLKTITALIIYGLYQRLHICCTGNINKGSFKVSTGYTFRLVCQINFLTIDKVKIHPLFRAGGAINPESLIIEICGNTLGIIGQVFLEIYRIGTQYALADADSLAIAKFASYRSINL